MRNIDLIVIHCSATREGHELSLEQLREMHLARGFSDIGYHFYIRRDGTILNGRPIERIGAHVKGHNKTSIGICYEGGLDKNGKAKDTRTEAQKRSILAKIQELRFVDIGKNVDVCGHRDLSPDRNHNGIIEPQEWLKQCPCFNAVEEYN